jgi:hypothetical protein
LPEVRELLRADIEAAYEGDPAALRPEEIILSYRISAPWSRQHTCLSVVRTAHYSHSQPDSATPELFVMQRIPYCRNFKEVSFILTFRG